jgi:hypothetical protein
MSAQPFGLAPEVAQPLTTNAKESRTAVFKADFIRISDGLIVSEIVTGSTQESRTNLRERRIKEISFELENCPDNRHWMATETATATE